MPELASGADVTCWLAVCPDGEISVAVTAGSNASAQEWAKCDGTAEFSPVRSNFGPNIVSEYVEFGRTDHGKVAAATPSNCASDGKIGCWKIEQLCG